MGQINSHPYLQGSFIWSTSIPPGINLPVQTFATTATTIPRTNLTIGQRAFSWASVLIWNSKVETLLPTVYSNAG